MFCTTIESLKKYLPTVINSEYEKYQAEVLDANRWLRNDVIGPELFDSVQAGDYFEDIDALTAHCESVVARKAYLEGIPSFDLTETSAGFVVTRNENQAPASPERVKKLQDSIAHRLTDAVESLLQYLEENTDYHALWKGSPTYALLTDTYIHTLTEFRRYTPWPGSRIEWIAAKPSMLNVIRLKIEPVISSELSDCIIEELRDDDLDEANTSIIENLKFAFANFCVGEESAGNAYLYKVRKKLMANPSDFPTWENSELYAAIVASTVDKYKTDRPFFRAGF
jgi:hypothetical protein